MAFQLYIPKSLDQDALTFSDTLLVMGSRVSVGGGGNRKLLTNRHNVPVKQDETILETCYTTSYLESTRLYLLCAEKFIKGWISRYVFLTQ